MIYTSFDRKRLNRNDTRKSIFLVLRFFLRTSSHLSSLISRNIFDDYIVKSTGINRNGFKTIHFGYAAYRMHHRSVPLILHGTRIQTSLIIFSSLKLFQSSFILLSLIFQNIFFFKSEFQKNKIVLTLIHLELIKSSLHRIFTLCDNH